MGHKSCRRQPHLFECELLSRVSKHITKELVSNWATGCTPWKSGIGSPGEWGGWTMEGKQVTFEGKPAGNRNEAKFLPCLGWSRFEISIPLTCLVFRVKLTLCGLCQCYSKVKDSWEVHLQMTLMKVWCFSFSSTSWNITRKRGSSWGWKSWDPFSPQIQLWASCLLNLWVVAQDERDNECLGKQPKQGCYGKQVKLQSQGTIPVLNFGHSFLYLSFVRCWRQLTIKIKGKYLTW